MLKKLEKKVVQLGVIEYSNLSSIDIKCRIPTIMYDKRYSCMVDDWVWDFFNIDDYHLGSNT